MKDRIYKFITEKGGGVSFAEITKEFGSGDYYLGKTCNVEFWWGMTADTTDAIDNLLKEKRILAYPTSPMVYLMDGAVPNMPLVTPHMPKNGYKKPHWLPVVLWTIEQIRNDNNLLTDPKEQAIYRDDGYDL